MVWVLLVWVVHLLLSDLRLQSGGWYSSQWVVVEPWRWVKDREQVCLWAGAWELPFQWV